MGKDAPETKSSGMPLSMVFVSIARLLLPEPWKTELVIHIRPSTCMHGDVIPCRVARASGPEMQVTLLLDSDFKLVDCGYGRSTGRFNRKIFTLECGRGVFHGATEASSVNGEHHDAGPQCTAMKRNPGVLQMYHALELERAQALAGAVDCPQASLEIP